MSSDDQKPFLSILVTLQNKETRIPPLVQAIQEVASIMRIHFELILINNGQRGSTWATLVDLANRNPRIRIINLLQRYSLQVALYCGIRDAQGQLLIHLPETFDIHPKEMLKLIDACKRGHDLVFGVIPSRNQTLLDKVFYWFFDAFHELFYFQGKNIQTRFFFLMRRQLMSNLGRHSSAFPCITGLLHLYAHKPISVPIDFYRNGTAPRFFLLKEFLRSVSGTFLYHQPIVSWLFVLPLAFLSLAMAFASVTFGTLPIWVKLLLGAWCFVFFLTTRILEKLVSQSALTQYRIKQIYQKKETPSAPGSAQG